MHCILKHYTSTLKYHAGKQISSYETSARASTTHSNRKVSISKHST